MEIIEKRNVEIAGNHNRPILTDFYYKNDGKPKPIIIFCHGYKGFKDWGAWGKWPAYLQRKISFL